MSDSPADFLYSNEAVISHMIFTSCRNWNAPECPHLKNKHMQMAVINESTLFLLSDMTLSEINKLGCVIKNIYEAVEACLSVDIEKIKINPSDKILYVAI